MIFGSQKVLAAGLSALALLSGVGIAHAVEQSAMNHCQLVKTPNGRVPLLRAPRDGSKVVVQMRRGDELEVFDGQFGAWRKVRRWQGPIPYDRIAKKKTYIGWVKNRYITDCDI
jgi:hypothetical protein